MSGSRVGPGRIHSWPGPSPVGLGRQLAPNNSDPPFASAIPIPRSHQRFRFPVRISDSDPPSAPAIPASSFALAIPISPFATAIPTFDPIPVPDSVLVPVPALAPVPSGSASRCFSLRSRAALLIKKAALDHVQSLG